MPSKRQRAKKPGSKFAQENVRAESQGIVWPAAEDDAAQWTKRQPCMGRESDTRGRDASPGVSRETAIRAKSKKAGQERAGSEESCGGKGKHMQDAVKHNNMLGMDEVDNATKGEMEVHIMPAHQVAVQDEMNSQKKPTTHKDKEKLKVEDEATSLVEIAMQGLLKEHGLHIVPAEWRSEMGKLLFHEVILARVKKLEKARKQREKRRENRKQKG